METSRKSVFTDHVTSTYLSELHNVFVRVVVLLDEIRPVDPVVMKSKRDYHDIA